MKGRPTARLSGAKAPQGHRMRRWGRGAGWRRAAAPCRGETLPHPHGVGEGVGLRKGVRVGLGARVGVAVGVGLGVGV